MASTYNPLTGQVTTTPDAVKTTPNLSQFNVPQSAPIPVTKTAPMADVPRPEKESSTFPPKGTIIGYLESQPGTRIRKTADGKGGYTTSLPEVDPDYKATTTGGSGAVIKTDAQIAAEIAANDKKEKRQSAYDLLYQQFKLYGLESLVEPLKGLIISNVSDSQFTIELRASEAYKKRFAANAKRIANGFKAIDEATYLGLEDKYQSIMQNYGLPASYYAKGDMGIQAGFEELIGGNVDPITLEERIMEGQKVTKANKGTIDAAKQFFPSLTDGDFLAYAINPKNALSDIKRKVTQAEIGGAALTQGLATDVTRAEQLASYGITKQMAEQGYGTIAGGLQRGSELASIYGQSPYDQKTAEQEVFNLAGGTEAARERKKITGLEKAEFGARSGLSGGALSRDRAGGV